MKTKRTLTTSPEYRGNSILVNEAQGLAADTRILDRISAQFDYAEGSKSKTFFFRYDLHFPKDMKVPSDNEHFKHFISAYTKNLARKGLAPQYFAVREQRQSEHQHYHVGVLLDGQKTRNPYEHLKTADRLWANELGINADNPSALGIVNHCDKDKKTGERMVNGMMLDATKDNYEYIRDSCFRRASYLAKENQKQMTPKGQREYFASKLPKEYK